MNVNSVRVVDIFSASPGSGCVDGLTKSQIKRTLSRSRSTAAARPSDTPDAWAY
jgi:hypothetical protein